MAYSAFGETTQATACAALPSGQAAFDLLAGKWSAIGPVVGYTLARSILVGLGMAVAGERKHIVRNAIAGALAIEGFVLVWALLKNGTTPPVNGG